MVTTKAYINENYIGLVTQLWGFLFFSLSLSDGNKDQEGAEQAVIITWSCFSSLEYEGSHIISFYLCILPQCFTPKINTYIKHIPPWSSLGQVTVMLPKSDLKKKNY